MKLKKKTGFFKISLFIFSVVLACCQKPLESRYSQFKYSIEEAKRVFVLIEFLELERIKPNNNPQELRYVEVQESELNSYFAYRIEAENEEIMKQLHFKIFRNNRIEGKILIDLRGQKIPDFLRPEMNIYFAGKVEVKEGKGRILMKKLFLEDQSIQPQILDAIIFIASKLQGSEPTSLYDWYELPYGIKDIKTKRQQALFFY